MTRSDTRSRIMDIAQEAVLAKGFVATSIDEIVAAADITKGGFFYHFADKTELACALIERYIDAEDAIFNEIELEAKALNDDPLGAMLIGLELLARKLDDMPHGHPGCMIASAAYQERQFDPKVRELNLKAVKRWRLRFRAHFEQVLERYELREEVDLDALSDLVTAAVEGGIVLSKAFQEPAITASQVRLARNYLKLLFVPRKS